MFSLGLKRIVLLAGLHLLVEPISRAVMKTAREAQGTAIDAHKADKPDDETGANASGFEAFVKTLAVAVIKDWDGGLDDDGKVIPGGVGDKDGVPLPVSADAVGQLMALHEPSELFFQRVIKPHLDAVAEKNA